LSIADDSLGLAPVLELFNCPICGKPLERGFIEAEWALVRDEQYLTSLRQIDADDRQGKSGGNYYGGRSFHLIHRTQPIDGRKQVHCLLCMTCHVVVACARDDATFEFPNRQPAT
jgi:hypothetical protein